MSTRSLIAAIQPDKTIKSIYCHFDGYLEGVGKKLYKNYIDPVKVNELIELGDLSSLGYDVERTVTYGSGADVAARFCMTKKGLLTIGRNMGVNFIYLFNGDYWSFYNICPDGLRWRKLTNTLVAPPHQRP